MAKPLPRIDPEEQIAQMHGAADLVRHLGQGALSTIAGGLAGLGNLPAGMDRAEAARQAVTEGLAPGDLSPEGIKTVQDKVAPVYHALMDSSGPTVSIGGHDLTMPTLGQNIDSLAGKYGEGVQADANIAGKYLGAPAAGAIGMLGEVAPNMIVPEGGAERAVAGRLPAGAGAMMGMSPERLLEDGANARTLAREAEARRRMTEDGIQPEPYSEPFAGRQAEHEGAVALRQKPSHTIQMEPAETAQAPWAPKADYPEGTMAFTARDPETGDLLSRQIVAKRGNTMQSVRMDTRPDMQGQGIGTSLLQKAVNHAHDNGMDFASDTQVSVPAMKTYLKHPGDSFLNPAHEEVDDPIDGPVIRSSNGQPIVSFPRPQDDAEPGQYIASQAHARGGKVGETGAVLGGLGDLIKQYAPLKGMPTKATVPGMGTFDVGPHQPARDAAAAYMKEAGLPYNPPSQYAQVDPTRAKQIADAFEAMPHNPSDPAVKASYDAMIKETLGQYQHMKNAGMNVEFMPQGKDPYAASPRLATEDVRKNNHMYVYPTDAGFGSAGDNVADNPLLAQSGEHFGGIPATNNDIFRAVHDYFGHAKEGVGFRANGEENAWRQHAGMYSDLARPAMTAETRGQNSWLNYGPHGDTNRTAKTADTVFAPQKTGILPDEFNNLEDPELHFLHMSNLSTPAATLDPGFYGTGIKGAEARRGGTKTTSLYPADIAPSDIEHGLESKTPYRVSVPRSSMYDLTADPKGYLSTPSATGNSPDVDWHKPDLLDNGTVSADSVKSTYAPRAGIKGDPQVYKDYLPVSDLQSVSGSLHGSPRMSKPKTDPGVFPPIKVALTDDGMSIIDGEHRTQAWGKAGYDQAPAWVLDYRSNPGPSASPQNFNEVEDAIKGAGYAGYHVPEGQGIFRGQGRMFGPTPATRLGPGPDWGRGQLDVPDHSWQAGHEPEEDLSAGFAEGGEVGPVLGGIGDLVKKYATVTPLGASTPTERALSAFAKQNQASVRSKADDLKAIVQHWKDNGVYPHEVGERLLSPKGNVYTVKAQTFSGRATAPRPALQLETGTPGEDGWSIGNHNPEMMGPGSGWQKFEGPRTALTEQPRSWHESLPLWGAQEEPEMVDLGHSQPDAANGFADGGSVGEASLLSKYTEPDLDQAAQLHTYLQDHGSVLYNPHTGEVSPVDNFGDHVPTHVTMLSTHPSPTDIHDLIMKSKPLMDGMARIFAGKCNGGHVMGVAHLA